VLEGQDNGMILRLNDASIADMQADSVGDQLGAGDSILACLPLRYVAGIWVTSRQGCEQLQT